jgi:hypothetical protein
VHCFLQFGCVIGSKNSTTLSASASNLTLINGRGDVRGCMACSLLIGGAKEQEMVACSAGGDGLTACCHSHNDATDRSLYQSGSLEATRPLKGEDWIDYYPRRRWMVWKQHMSKEPG